MQNRLAVAHVAVILVPGLTPDLFGISEDQLSPMKITPDNPSIRSELSFLRTHNVPYVWPTRAPGDRTKLYSPSTTFLNAPLSKAEKKNIERMERSSGAGSDSGAILPLDSLLMTADNFVACDYPLHSDILAQLNDEQPLPEGWVETGNPSLEKNSGVLVQGKYRVLGLDCEMVMTANGSALARVTVVDWNLQTILDQLVLPDEPVTDFLTRYSGITAKLLEGITTTVSDIQEKLTQLISKEDILTGHSLENDLRVLRIRHPRVIDTAVIYSHARGHPLKPALKYLANRFLNKDIQKQTGNTGHDSAEDARTCIELVKKKLEKGLDFGKPLQSTEPLLRRLARASEASHAAAIGAERGTRTGTGAVVDYGNPAQWHGTDARTIVCCKNDDEVVAGIKENARRHDFVWARMRELEFARGWVPQHNLGNDGSTKELTDEEKDAAVSNCLSNLNARLNAIWESLPPTTIVIVLSGSGDPREMSRLNALRLHFHEEFKSKKWDDITTPWTDVEEQQLIEATKVARSGVSFIAIKPAPTSDDE